MPYPAVTDEYYDDILYWGNPVDDGFGNYTFDDPVELKARWIEKTQLKLDGVTGQDVVMNVVISIRGRKVAKRTKVGKVVSPQSIRDCGVVLLLRSGEQRFLNETTILAKIVGRGLRVVWRFTCTRITLNHLHITQTYGLRLVMV